MRGGRNVSPFVVAAGRNRFHAMTIRSMVQPPFQEGT